VEASALEKGGNMTREWQLVVKDALTVDEGV
jgi:hypothetical protein